MLVNKEYRFKTWRNVGFKGIKKVWGKHSVVRIIHKDVTALEGIYRKYKTIYKGMLFDSFQAFANPDTDIIAIEEIHREIDPSEKRVYEIRDIF